MKNYNLKLVKDRLETLTELTNNCLNDLREIGLELCPTARVIINVTNIAITDGNSNSSSFSDITLHSSNNSFISKNNKNTINFGSSGEFSPKDDNPFWRTIHAASILKNWEATCKIVNEYCQKYNELVVAIEEANDCKIISA